MSDGGWTAVVLEIPRSIEEEVAGILGDGSLGVEVVPIAEDRCRLKVYASSRSEANRIREHASSSLRELAWTAGRSPAAVEVVEDLRWAERYQEALRPFPVGERFLVVPDGRGPADSTRVPIVLVPGRAFGTGEHATTRLCIETLERWVRPGSRWLDLGCGTGILSLVAMHLGAAAVEARDIDPEALEVAREVLAVNRAGQRVRLDVGGASDLAGAQLDGVVANIASEYFVSKGMEAAATLRRGGVLLAGGVLLEEMGAVDRALRREGFRTVERLHREGWGLLVSRSSRPENEPL